MRQIGLINAALRLSPFAALKNLAVAAVVLALSPISAHAIPIVVGGWANSGGTFGPDDDVTFVATLTNVGDMSFSGTFQNAFQSPGNVFATDYTSVGGGFDDIPLIPGVTILTLNPGETLSFNFWTWVAQSPADGDYFGSGAIRFFNETDIDLGEFDWRVNSAVSVSEPGTLALLGLGLAGMGLTRRKKKI